MVDNYSATGRDRIDSVLYFDIISIAVADIVRYFTTVTSILSYSYVVLWPTSYFRNHLITVKAEVERLQEISEEDCVAEGITTVWPKNESCGEYVHLWNRINGKKHPWERNEWVVAYTFERILFGAQTGAKAVQGRC